MTDKYCGEKVLVIKRELFDQIGAFHGWCAEVDRYLPEFLGPENNFFLDRAAAECDPTHKQLIPYAVLRCGDRILRYVRGKKSGEQRLASKASVGIGGHVNQSDFAAPHLGEQTYLNGVERELQEELKICGHFSQRVIALINDDSNEVGQVHLGVVHLIDLESEDVESNEEAITELGFFTLEELHEDRERLETWSQIVIDGLLQIVD